MIRQLAGAMALAVASVVVAIAPAHAQDQKGTLVFAVELLGAQTLDPILEGRPGNAVYQAIMYDSLVGFDLKKGGVGPGVAERWELSPDGLTWTFFIRPGQTFHNGDKLTAHDVKFSLERQMGPGSLASAAASMKRTIKSIEVVDDLTVKVNTTSPQIGLPASLSRAVAPEGAIMPKNYIEKVGEEEFRKKPIGSGPWKFVRNVPGDRIEFTAVANHWRGTPSFKDLHVLLVPEESTRVAMVRTGEAAIASIGPETMLGASRAGLEVLAVPGTMQAIFQFWGTWKPEHEGFADRQAARAPGAVAGDRPQAGDRARHERQGAHALSVLDLRLHRVSQRRPLGEVGGRGLSLRSGAGQEDPGRGGLSQRLRAEVRQHRAAGHAVHGRYRHRHRRHVDQGRRQGDAEALRMGLVQPHGARRPGAARGLGLDVPHRRPARRAVALRRRLLARKHPAPAGRQGQLPRDLPGVRQDRARPAAPSSTRPSARR